MAIRPERRVGATRLADVVSWEALAIIAIAPLVGFLCFARLASFPAITGWDEGIYLEFAHNLARHGEYGTRDGLAFRRLVPAGGSGPTLILPLAVAFRLAGDTLLAARIVMAAYLVLAVAGGYLLVRRVGGVVAAVCSIPLLLVAGHGTFDTLFIGRQALAEVPALAFLLFGLYAWLRGWREGSRWSACGGVLLGLAILTKNQLLMIVVPAAGLLALADALYYRRLRWLERIVPLAAAGTAYLLWLALSLWIVGRDQWSAYLDLQSSMTNAQFMRINPEQWIENAHFVISSGQSLSAVVAIAAGLFASRQRSIEGLTRLVLPAFAGVGFLAFTATTVPWPRQIYPSLALAALCLALALGDLRRGFERRWGQRRDVPLGAVAIVVLLLAGPRLWDSVDRINTAENSGAERFGALVDRQVPAGEFVAGWEWEVEFYSERDFVHPPFELFPAMIRQVYGGSHDSILDEPRIPNGARYLVVGPFARDTRAFDDELRDHPHSLVIEDGPYQLFLLKG